LRRLLATPFSRLFRTHPAFSVPAGFLFLAQVLDDSKLKQVDSIYDAFSSADKANKIVKLKVSIFATRTLQCKPCLVLQPSNDSTAA
jgi:hypothetical protein